VNVEVAQSNRLPGGVGVWRGWWILARDAGMGVVLAFAPLLLLGILLVAIGIIGRDPAALGFVIGPVVASWLLVRLYRPGVAVTAQGQPDVHALVVSAADRTGVAPPDRIWLTATPTVTARTRIGRRKVHIGLPLLACLSRTEMAALVGHALSLLHHRRPWLVTRLWSRTVQVGQLLPGEPSALVGQRRMKSSSASSTS